MGEGGGEGGRRKGGRGEREEGQVEIPRWRSHEQRANFVHRLNVEYEEEEEEE